MQRYVIEQSTAQQIAGELVRAFDEFCAKSFCTLLCLIE
jgi:hypothetical protein